MNAQDPFIEKLKRDVEYMQSSIEEFQSGRADVGEVDTSGNMTSLKEQMIAHYERTIQELQDIIDRAEKRSGQTGE